MASGIRKGEIQQAQEHPPVGFEAEHEQAVSEEQENQFNANEEGKTVHQLVMDVLEDDITFLHPLVVRLYRYFYP